MKDSTSGYCSCYAGLFGCTTEWEESKKLRVGTFWPDILVVNLFVHPNPDPTWSFDITADFLLEFSCSATAKGSILKSSTLAFFYQQFQFELSTRSVLIIIACK